MAFSDIMGPSKVTGVGTAYSSTTGRNVMLAVYSHAF
jgi:hypothetical protein